MAAKQKDITQTGPKGLRGIRNEDLYGNSISNILSDQTFEALRSSYGRNTASNYRAARGELGYSEATDSSLFTPQVRHDLDYGSSIYDEGLMVEPTQEDINNKRADAQSGLLQVTNGVIKGAITAGTTFVDGTVGLLFGLGQGIYNMMDNDPNTGFISGLYDNAVSNFLNQINKESEKIFVNYYSTDELNGSLWDNLTSANFWGDQFLKNLGFTVGAYYSGKLPAALIGKVGKTAMKAAYNANKNVRTVKNTAKGAQMIGGSFFSAVNEGRVEALNNMQDWTAKQEQEALDIYHQELGKKYQAMADQLEKTLQANKGSLVQDGESGNYYDPAFRQYQTAKAQMIQMYEYEMAHPELNEQYRNIRAKISQDAAKVGNTTLGMNLAILMPTNLYEFGRLYASGWRTGRRVNNIKGRFTNEHAERIARGEVVNPYKRGTTRVKGVLKGLGNSYMESQEEVLQGVGANTAGIYYENDVHNYIKSQYDPDAEQQVVDWNNALTQALDEAWSSKETATEAFIGGLTGAIGMPRFKKLKNSQGKWQSPIVFEGGLYGDWKENSAQMKREDELVDYMNSRVNDPKFIKQWRNAVAAQARKKEQQGFLDKDDQKAFKDSEYAQLIADIAAFDDAGKLDDFIDIIKNSADVADADIDDIVQATTKKITAQEQQENFNRQMQQLTEALEKARQENAKKEVIEGIQAQIDYLNTLAPREGFKDVYVGPYVDENGNSTLQTKQAREQFIKDMKKKADSLLQTVDTYVNTRAELIEELPEALTSDQLDYLTYLKTQLVNWEKRGIDIAENLRPALEYLKSKLDSEGFDIDFDNPQNTGRNSRRRNNAQALISDLNKLLGINNTALRDTLSNPENLGWVVNLMTQLSSLTEPYIKIDNTRSVSVESYLRALEDLVRISESRKAFEETLKEYTKNPEKITEEHDKAKEKAQRSQTAKEQQVKVDTARNSRANELANNPQVDDDWLSEAEAALTDSEGDEQARQNISNARGIRQTTQQAREKAQQALADGRMSQQEYDDFTAMLERSKAASETPEELFDMDTEAWNDTGALDIDEASRAVSEQAASNQINLDEAQASIQRMKRQRLDKARSIGRAILDEINQERQRQAQMPQPNPTPTPQTAPQAEATTGHDPVEVVPPVNAPRRTRGRRDSTIAAELGRKYGISPDSISPLIADISRLISQIPDATIQDAISVIKNTPSARNILTVSPNIDLNQLISDIYTEKKTGKNPRVGAKPTTKDRTDDPTPDSGTMESSINADRNASDFNTRENVSAVNGVYHYWRPVTSQFVRSRVKGETRAYWETLPDSSPVKERLRILHEFLSNHNVFDRIRENDVREGQTIHFGISKELTQKHEFITILMLNERNEVIGDLPVPTDANFGMYAGLGDFYQVAKDWWESRTAEDNEGDIISIPGYTSKIAKNLIGRIQFSKPNERHTLNEIHTKTKSDGTTEAVPFQLGIAVSKEGDSTRIMASPGRRASQGVSRLEQTIVPPLIPSPGQPYLLMPTSSKRRAFVCVPISIPRFNSNNPVLTNSRLGKIILAKIRELSVLPNNIRDIKKWQDAIQDLLAVKRATVHFRGRQMTVSVIMPGTDTEVVVYQGEQTSPELMNTILGNLNNLNVQIQVSRKYINTQMNGVNYNELIGEIANTNLPVGATHTTDDWFTIDPIVKGKSVKAKSPKSTRKNPTSSISKNGETKATHPRLGNLVMDSEDKLFQEVDGSLKELTGSEYDKVKAWMWGIKTSSPMTQPYQTKWGLFNPQTEKFVDPPTPPKEAPREAPKTQPSQEEPAQPLSREESMGILKSGGVLVDKVIKSVLERLSDTTLEQLTRIHPIVLKQYLNRVKALLKPNASDQEVEELVRSTTHLDAPFSEQTQPEGTYEVIDAQSEIDVITKILPQLSEEGRIAIHNGLIKITGRRNPGRAWGMFRNGVITLSNIAIRGTAYHEAFHFVSQTLLTDKELSDLYKEASKRYGDMSTLALEEKLAEDFRVYMQRQETFFGRVFNKLRHIINSLFGNGPKIDHMFREISKGRFSQRKIWYNSSTFYSERDIQNEIYEQEHLIETSKDDYKREVEQLESTWKRLKSLAAQRGRNAGLLPDVYALRSEAEEHINQYMRGMVEVVEDRGSYRFKLIKDGLQQRKEEAKRRFENEQSRLSQELEKLNSQYERWVSERALEEQEDNFYREVESYHQIRLSYRNLTAQQKQHLKDIGVSREEYNNSTFFEKETYFKCM